MPLKTVGLTGVRAIDTSVGGVTVKSVEPVTAFSVAEIVDVPGAALVANPSLPARLLMVAMAGTDEAHVTDVVTFTERAGPVNVPVAVNCRVDPSAIEGFTGVTAMEVRPVALPVPLRLTSIGLPKAL